MKNQRKFLILLLTILLIHCAWGGPPVEPIPNLTQLPKCRADFIGLQTNIVYRFVVDREDSNWKEDNSSSHVELLGETANFIGKYDLPTLALSLWPLLDDPARAADASACLFGAMKTQLGGTSPAIVKDTQLCKWAVRRAFNQPNWWYPHQILFDRETVLIESKTSAVVRANYIAAMQKALADPKIRTENPLEVKSILGLLCELKAVEAVATFCDYLFFDWKTGSDYIIQDVERTKLGEYPSSALAAIACLARLGEPCFPDVINCFANATDIEYSAIQGGKGVPILATRYFHLRMMKEEDALQKIDAYKKSHRSLTDRQAARLDTLVNDIRAKKYRPSSMKGSDWAAPSNAVTNAPTIK